LNADVRSRTPRDASRDVRFDEATIVSREAPLEKADERSVVEHFGAHISPRLHGTRRSSARARRDHKGRARCAAAAKISSLLSTVDAPSAPIAAASADDVIEEPVVSS